MPPVHNLLGMKFSKLTVVSRLPNRKYKNSSPSLWVCRCDCGATCERGGSDLVRGRTTSCGCLHKERVRKAPGHSGLRDLFSTYKRNARKRNVSFSLSLGQFAQLTSRDCSYCGTTPTQVNITHYERSLDAQNHEAYKYNGIDRVDNSIGYVWGNCVPCCKWCNYAKRERSTEEFISWACKVAALTAGKVMVA